ncbi:MAG: hypothetical protein NXI16_09255 [Alphaproteobacteria bacterium]|nr:hypothetical protein [Alphaproteobacteria bacterium]
MTRPNTGSEMWTLTAACRDPATGDEAVIRATTHPNFATRPGDEPANTPFPPLLESIGVYAKHAFAPGRTAGSGRSVLGTVRLANGVSRRGAPAPLDHLRGYSFDGRALVIRKGPDRGRMAGRSGGKAAPPRFPADYPPVFTGTVERAEWGLGSLDLLIRNRQGEVALRPIQEEIYKGDNTLPEGREGGADLKDKWKPLLLGRARNFSPPRVNRSRNLYQISTAPVTLVDGAFDRGIALTRGILHGTLAGLESASVQPGHYDLYLGGQGDGAFLRLGSDAEVLTVDAAAGATETDRTPVALARQILTDHTTLGPADIGADALAIPHEAGLWIGPEGGEVGGTLDRLLTPLRGWWLDGRDGVFRLGRLTPPMAADAVDRLGEAEIGMGPLDIGTRTGAAPDDGIVPRSIAVAYAWNQTVRTDSAAAAGERADFAAEAWRTVKRPLSSPLDYPLGQDLIVETALQSDVGATWAADQLEALYGTRREILAVRVHPRSAARLEVGNAILLDVGRFDWRDKPMRIIGFEEDLGGSDAGGSTLIYLWG